MQGKCSQILLAIFFILAGCLHFLFPASYMKIMPAWLAWHFALVMISGMFEIAGGVGVFVSLHATLRGFWSYSFVARRFAREHADVGECARSR